MQVDTCGSTRVFSKFFSLARANDQTLGALEVDLLVMVLPTPTLKTWGLNSLFGAFRSTSPPSSPAKSMKLLRASAKSASQSSKKL